MSAKNEWRKVIRAAVQQGWRLRETKKGVQLLAPDGEGIVTVHRTPSDHRALANTVAKMRQHGFKWPGRGDQT